MYKVLIVDDEIYCRILLEQMIDCYDKNIAVKSTATGAEALDIIVSEPPDLVFVDLQMPGIDGERLCKIIKKNEENENIKIIVTTAKLLNVVKNADAVLNKPFTLKDITNVCDRYLKKSNICEGKGSREHSFI